MMRKIDAHIRRRLRAILLRHWKRKRTIARRLVKLGVPRQSAWRQVYEGRKSWWALSHIPAVDHGLNRAFFRERGLVAVVEMHRRAHQHIGAPDRRNWRYGDDFEVANRPAAGVITRRPEEPYTNSVRTVLWEPGRVTAPATRARVCRARMLRSEVEVLSWSPDRGNPTSKRQGRGPELTGRLQCGLVMRCGASVRACLEEAIDALWSRTKVKRRKAPLGWVSWPAAAMPDTCRYRRA